MSTTTLLLLLGIPTQTDFGKRRPPSGQGPGCGWFLFMLLVGFFAITLLAMARGW